MITFAAILVLGCTASKAQGILDKIENTNDKINRAGNTADRTKTTGDKIMGLFGKKKKDVNETAENKTLIKVAGATLSTLKSINEKVAKSKGVSATKMKFSAAGSSITVQHSGSTDDLLKALQKSPAGFFEEKNIEGLDEGEISLKIK